MRTKVIVELSDKYLKVCIGRKVRAIKLANIDSPSILAALNSVFKDNKQIKNFDVFVVIGRNKITVRRVELPSQDLKEIEQMLGLYLIRQIPYRKEEVCWAYQNLGFDGINNSCLILAVVLKNVFNGIVNSFIPMNILPEAVLMSTQGLLHYVNESIKDKALTDSSYFILDIDENYSDLVLVHRHKLGSSVVIPMGTDNLNSLTDRERFSAELAQSLLVLSNEVLEAKCERIFLTGASLAYIDTVEKAAIDLRLKAQYLSTKEYDVFAATEYKGISLSSVLGFSYQVAKDDIRFIIPELQVKKDMKAKTQQLIILGAALVFILVMLCGIGLVRLIQKHSYSASLRVRAGDLEKNAKELDFIIDSLKVVKQYVDFKSSALFFIAELSRLCPDNITITNYSWEWKKGLSFRGYAKQIPDILSFVSTLNGSEAFKGAQNRYTRRRKAKDKEVVDFEIFIK
jgi:hypothetical protein